MCDNKTMNHQTFAGYRKNGGNLFTKLLVSDIIFVKTLPVKRYPGNTVCLFEKRGEQS